MKSGLDAVSQSPDCRLVVFYRIQPATTQLELPAGAELGRVNGWAIGGIAVVRRQAVRLLPRRLCASVTATHFLHVLCRQDQQCETGALVLRRDTSSRIQAWLGRGGPRRRGHHARFQLVSLPGRVTARWDSDDRHVHVAIDAEPEPHLTPNSMFGSKAQLLQLLRDDLRGLRLVPPPQRLGRTRAAACESQLVPLHVTRLESSVFEDATLFPEGAAVFDSAFCLREEELVWSQAEAVCCDGAPA